MDGQTDGWMGKRSACRVLARNAWACALCYALSPLVVAQPLATFSQ